MTRSYNTLCRLIAALLCGAMLLIASAPAQANPPPPGTTASSGTSSSGSGNAARSGDLETRDAQGNKKKCTDYGVLTGAMVPCIMHNIETTGVKIAEEFAKLLKPAIAAFLTLVIIFFGVKVVQGEGQVGAKAVLLILKIAFVIGILEIMPSTIPMVHSAMKESTTLVAEVLADESDFHCDLTNFRKPGGDLLWAQMDCVLGKLFGFVSGANGQPNMMLAASGIGLLSGFMFGGTTALFVFFAILGVLYTLFTLVWKTLLGYVNGFIVATLLIIISPLFLPLALMQVTAQYFDKWWKGILAAMLLPIFITSYVMLALMLYDKILLAPDSEVNKLFQEDIMSEMQRLNDQMCGPHALQDQSISERAAASDPRVPQTNEQRVQDSNFINSILPSLSGNSAPCVSVDTIEMPTEMINRIFIGLVKILITSIIVTQGLSMVQGSVRNITGSSMASSALDPVSTLEQGVDSAMRRSRSAMEDVANAPGADGGTARGTEFIGRVPDMFRAGIGGLIGQRLGDAPAAGTAGAGAAGAGAAGDDASGGDAPAAGTTGAGATGAGTTGADRAGAGTTGASMSGALERNYQQAREQIENVLESRSDLTPSQISQLETLLGRINVGSAGANPLAEVTRILGSGR